ncbi:DUF6226 family protein [Micrococcus yunnanensis]|uniref:DUF6226 family protein n=1 Tax=Micrococcus yunnanensis TaxID=566027 RepID=UPI003B8A6ECC
MTTLPRLRAEVARRYAALDLPAWPAPHPDGAPPREEEYSRVTDPQRYRIAGARARVWAEVLAEAGAAVAPGGGRRPGAGARAAAGLRMRRLRPRVGRAARGRGRVPPLRTVPPPPARRAGGAARPAPQ